jgi:6,7-dimethyl-8-ribityllumazine synthase
VSRTTTPEHAAGELKLPTDVAVLVGEVRVPEGDVAVAVSRFNGEFTTQLLESALAELERAGVRRERVTVLVVPGAFELPAAVATLARSSRYGCVIALGCVIRGETAHFDYVAGEAAAGLRQVSVETGVPVAFGVITADTSEQARARVENGAGAVRAALETADVFRLFHAAS